MEFAYGASAAAFVQIIKGVCEDCDAVEYSCNAGQFARPGACVVERAYARGYAAENALCLDAHEGVLARGVPGTFARGTRRRRNTGVRV
jgi:hypothetical protein